MLERVASYWWVELLLGLFWVVIAVVVLTDRPFDDWAAEQWPPLLDGVLADDRLTERP